MSSENALPRWLQKELPKRGYQLEGHRAGGISRLAKDAGIPQATASRLVNGVGEPSLDSLRKVGKVLGYTLGEMMIAAGLATPEEMTARITATTEPADPAPPQEPWWANPPDDLPDDVIWDGLPDPAMQAWHLSGLDVEERRIVMRVVVGLINQRYANYADNTQHHKRRVNG